MNPSKTRVVIAGGGTAGWLAAYSLVKRLGTQLEITLVESDLIGTVGVGEATIPTMKSFHGVVEIDEREFMAGTPPRIEAARPEDRSPFVDAMLKAIEYLRVGGVRWMLGAAGNETLAEVGCTADAQLRAVAKLDLNRSRRSSASAIRRLDQ